MSLFRKKQEEGKPQKPPTEKVSPIAEGIEDAQPVSKLLKKQKGLGDLCQFYYGTFDLRLDAIDYNCLQSVEEMLSRRDEGPRGGHKRGTQKKNTSTTADFAKVCEILKSKNVILSNMMVMTGDSYLESQLLKSFFDSDTTRKAFEPKKAKNRDTKKIAAFYRSILRLVPSKKLSRVRATLKTNVL
jgi:hypothetical protein